MTDKDLLEQLRIDDADRHGTGGHRWLWLFLSSLFVILGLAAAAYHLLEGTTLAVETVAVESADAGGRAAVLEATGYVTARLQATVSSKVAGKLAEVLIEEGESVQTGQVLARLDDTDARAHLDVVQARLEAARAQLGQIEAQLEQARRDLKRQEDLQAKRLTSDVELETQRTQVRTLSAQLAAQRSQVRVAEAELRVAEVDLDNTVVRAPFAGVVVAKTAQPGEIISPISAGGGFTRTGVGTVVDMGSLEIEVDVNEAYINRVRPEQPAEAVLDAYPDWKIPAAVIAIIPTADRSKATVKVRVALRERDNRIVPDMGTRVSFFDERETGETTASTGVLVPSSAIVERAGRSVAFVVEGGRARLRPVTPGTTQGERRRVRDGLEPGQRVVRNPPAGLADGMAVTTVTPGG
ncbi:MAG: efflux RND transporter periplasmic adaptor subunit [Gammaproteobacteria bacterium]|jgi:RND family efflux transporter MFP subunit|nr:efflux RND transporter periplasmic adaptor subunit [Gammaproteobacteria bacterium]